MCLGSLEASAYMWSSSRPFAEDIVAEHLYLFAVDAKSPYVL